VKLLKVTAYRYDVGNRLTAIEFEYRNRTIGIQGTERRGELFAVAQINLHARHSKTLLCKKNADAARAGRRYAVVKFHEGLVAVGRAAVVKPSQLRWTVAPREPLFSKDHHGAL
jgi:hypothetical protein